MLSGVYPGETKNSVLSPGRWADGRGSNSPVTHRRSSTASTKSEQRIEDFWLNQKFLSCLPFPIPPAPKTGGQLTKRGFFPGKEKLNISLWGLLFVDPQVFLCQETLTQTPPRNTKQNRIAASAWLLPLRRSDKAAGPWSTGIPEDSSDPDQSSRG